MRRGFGCALLLLAELTAVVVAADTVTLDGKPPFRNVKVTDYRGGRLVFRGVSREVLRIPIEQVRSFEIDGFDALNAAERATGQGRWAEAAEQYEKALKQASDRWLGDLIALRMLEACDRAGRFDRAVELFVERVDAKGGGASVQAPMRAGSCGSDVNQAARRRLERAIETTRSTTARGIFRKLLFELLIADDADDFDRLFPPPVPGGQGVGDVASSFAAASPLAPGERNLVRPAALNALASGQAERAVRMVRRILPYVESAGTEARPTERRTEARPIASETEPRPTASGTEARLPEEGDATGRPDGRDPWRLLLGRARVEAGDAVGAIGDLMELAHNAADAELAVEALYYAGLAHERIDRPDVAEELYREVLGKAAATAEMRLLAGKGLERVRAK